MARPLSLSVRKNAGFTLIEIALAVFIILIMLTLAVPSLRGVMADRRLRHSFDDLNNFVLRAQEQSVTERRPYIIAWRRDELILRPEGLSKAEEKMEFPSLRIRKGDAFYLQLPAALIKDPPPEWIFWPSGVCEPAVVSYKGADGTWSARFSALTARPEVTNFHPL